MEPDINIKFKIQGAGWYYHLGRYSLLFSVPSFGSTTFCWISHSYDKHKYLCAQATFVHHNEKNQVLSDWNAPLSLQILIQNQIHKVYGDFDLKRHIKYPDDNVEKFCEESREFPNVKKYQIFQIKFFVGNGIILFLWISPGIKRELMREEFLELLSYIDFNCFSMTSMCIY